MSEGLDLFQVLVGRLRALELEMRVSVPAGEGSEALIVANPRRRACGDVQVGRDGTVVFAYRLDDTGINRLVKDVNAYLKASVPTYSARLLDPAPFHVQVTRDMRQGIADGTYGRKLPAIPDLAREQGVATETMRRALGTLQDEGLVVIAEGRGTFVIAEAAPGTRRGGGSS